MVSRSWRYATEHSSRLSLAPAPDTSGPHHAPAALDTSEREVQHAPAPDVSEPRHTPDTLEARSEVSDASAPGMSEVRSTCRRDLGGVSEGLRGPASDEARPEKPRLANRCARAGGVGAVQAWAETPASELPPLTTQPPSITAQPPPAVLSSLRVSISAPLAATPASSTNQPMDNPHPERAGATAVSRLHRLVVTSPHPHGSSPDGSPAPSPTSRLRRLVITSRSVHKLRSSASPSVISRARARAEDVTARARTQIQEARSRAVVEVRSPRRSPADLAPRSTRRAPTRDLTLIASPTPSPYCASELDPGAGPASGHPRGAREAAPQLAGTYVRLHAQRSVSSPTAVSLTLIPHLPQTRCTRLLGRSTL